MELDIIGIINNVGFPIACVLGLFWYMIQKDKAYSTERAEMTTAIQNNTLVMHQILEILREDV